MQKFVLKKIWGLITSPNEYDRSLWINQIYDNGEHYPVSMTKNYDNDKPYPLSTTKFEND